jgi:hypothetical protein
MSGRQNPADLSFFIASIDPGINSNRLGSVMCPTSSLIVPSRSRKTALFIDFLKKEDPVSDKIPKSIVVTIDDSILSTALYAVR